MSDPKLVMGDVLAAADSKDFGFLDRLPEAYAKTFAPFPAMRMFSGANDGDAGVIALSLVNGWLNIDFNALSKHPGLQYRLLAACGRGRQIRHHWIAAAKQKRGASELHAFLHGHWPEANAEELNILLAQFTRPTFDDFVLGCGLSHEETEKILHAYDAHHGIEPQKTKKAKKR